MLDGWSIDGFQFTPLREGRPLPRRRNRAGGHFNSRPSARGDAARCWRKPCGRYFNSRPSARGDRTAGKPRSCPENFNSRPSARGDQCGVGDAGKHRISIHAPPRGATKRSQPLVMYITFQFTPLREGRRSHRERAGAEPADFNSRPSARGDPTGGRHARAAVRFQFTPLREGRRANQHDAG